MTMRILADENVDRPIASWLREQGHDVAEVAVVAQEAADADLIAMSRREGRILMSFDRDMVRLVQSDSAPHPGLSTSVCGAPGRSSGKVSSASGPRLSRA